ncbi:MAG TPA: AAA family ATPase [Thermoanaerobaculia bacterium]|nr:AAA family ATPase [Thermoanaerobaculia bacterium]
MSPEPGRRRVPDPQEIAAALSQRVLGQDGAVREMAVALAKHLAGLRVGNILMIGSSGTGKTTLMRGVEGYLASDPALAQGSTVVRIHANVLGEEAERGRPGEAVLGRLLARAQEQLGPGVPLETLLARVRSGLVFVDEVDKIRSTVGGQPNVAGIRAQEALLTLIENEAVPFVLPAWAGGATVPIDSSGLLFVCAGAFEGLYDSVYDRVTIGKDRGALQPVTVVDGGRIREELVFHLRDWLRNEDLFDYGMSPQFLSRFDAVVLLQDLSIDELVRIFLESPDSGFQQSRRYFEGRGIHLALSPAAARRIAAEAARQPRLGARALKEAFRRVIRDYEFDPAKAIRGAGGALLLDLPEIEAALGS